MLAKED